MKSKEIGSEFWSIPIQDENNLVFSDDTKWFISGRAALDFILKDILSYRRIKTVALPSWCCDSMIQPVLNNDLKFVFYPVVIENNELVINDEVDADVLLTIDYFGYKANRKKSFKGLVINDISHSVFTQTDDDCDYIFGSLRKWAGFKTGGFANARKCFSINANTYTNDEYVSLRKEAMIEKEKYINDQINKKDYLQVYAKAESMLENLFNYSSIEEDINSAKHFAVEDIKKQRQDNARVLLDTVKEYAIFKNADKDDCPLFVPIIVPDNKRDQLKAHLIKNNIFCPVHWPITDLHNLSKQEKYLYDNELSLVCDQRYNNEDMEYMCKKIKEFLC